MLHGLPARVTLDNNGLITQLASNPLFAGIRGLERVAEDPHLAKYVVTEF